MPEDPTASVELTRADIERLVSGFDAVRTAIRDADPTDKADLCRAAGQRDRPSWGGRL
jgi:hypothetical protein